MIYPGLAFKFVVRPAIRNGDLVAEVFGQRCLDGLIFGFGLISSPFIQKDVIIWWFSGKNEKTSRDKMIAIPNLKVVNHILV